MNKIWVQLSSDRYLKQIGIRAENQEYLFGEVLPSPTPSGKYFSISTGENFWSTNPESRTTFRLELIT